MQSLFALTRPTRDLFKLENRARRALGRPERPPGPATLMTPVSMASFFADQLSSVQWLHHTYGDVAYVKVAGLPFYVVHDQEMIKEVLLTKSDSFFKDTFTVILEDVLGKGLLTNEEPEWRRQRRLAAPALRRSQIAAYAEDMIATTMQTCAELTDGATIDLWGVSMEMTLKIVVKTLFGLEMPERIQEVGEAIENAMEYFEHETNSLWYFVPKHFPSPARKNFEDAVAVVDDIIYDLIDQRRRDPPGDDLLWGLMEARDEDGWAMSTRQLRDEAITMFMAGHETTALAITYAYWLMAQNPATFDRLAAEVDEVLAGRDALSLADVDALTYTEAVIKETMRLQPPAWIIGRRAIEDVQIGEYLLPKGSQVLMSQLVLHRDGRYFDDPMAFRPERWLGGTLERDLPRFTYFPFGGGPRICIGNHFAMMEAILCVAQMASEWSFELAHDPATIGYSPVVTLRPDRPIHMRAVRR